MPCTECTPTCLRHQHCLCNDRAGLQTFMWKVRDYFEFKSLGAANQPKVLPCQCLSKCCHCARLQQQRRLSFLPAGASRLPESASAPPLNPPVSGCLPVRDPGCHQAKAFKSGNYPTPCLKSCMCVFTNQFPWSSEKHDHITKNLKIT